MVGEVDWILRYHHLPKYNMDGCIQLFQSFRSVYRISGYFTSIPYRRHCHLMKRVDVKANGGIDNACVSRKCFNSLGANKHFYASGYLLPF